MGDHAHGQGGQRLAPQMVRQAPACVDAPAMQIAVAAFQQAQPLGPAGAAQPQFDLGKILPKAPDRFRHNRLHPERVGGRPDAAAAAPPGRRRSGPRPPRRRAGAAAPVRRPPRPEVSAARPSAAVRTATRRTGSPAGRWRGSAPAGSSPAGRPRRRSCPPRRPPGSSPARSFVRTWRRRRTIRPQDRIRNVNRPGRRHNLRPFRADCLRPVFGKRRPEGAACRSSAAAHAIPGRRNPYHRVARPPLRTFNARTPMR